MRLDKGLMSVQKICINLYALSAHMQAQPKINAYIIVATIRVCIITHTFTYKSRNKQVSLAVSGPIWLYLAAEA